jgi:hypothetical protein
MVGDVNPSELLLKSWYVELETEGMRCQKLKSEKIYE